MHYQTNLYTITVPPMMKGLQNLSGIIDKGVIHAKEREFDAAHLLSDRLVVDQFDFKRQVQIVCDYAKGTAARIAGVEVPKFEDNEKTAEDLKARIDKTVEYLKTFKPEDLIGKEDGKVEIYFFPGKYLPTFEYVTELAIPNFYFHLTTAYSILRKNGVKLGKGDYTGNLAFRDLK